MIESQLVSNWLSERQNLIVNLVALSDARRDRLPTSALQHFCDGLVDYVSAGHFKVYNELVSCPDAQHLLSQVYPTIQASTEQVLDFHDTLARPTDDALSVREALGNISIALESRFALEDELIDAARRAEQPSVIH